MTCMDFSGVTINLLATPECNELYFGTEDGV